MNSNKIKFDKNEFYIYNGNVIEGFICDDIKKLDDVRLLFILREPNSNDEFADKFWFKEIVEKNDTSNAYFSKLGKIACLLLNKGDDKQNAFKQCAYINLYPEKGGKFASENYKKVIKLFKKKDITDDFSKSRLKLINALPDGCNIVTVGDIFGAIKRTQGNANKTIQGLKINNKRVNKEFGAFSFNNAKGKIKVYSIYHPQTFGRSSFKAEDIHLIK